MASHPFLALSLTDVATGTICKYFTSLQADSIPLGRGARANDDCQLPTSGLFRSSQTKCMSQKHAELSWDKGQYAFLKDVGSTNGTFVEREGAEAWKLKAGIPYRLKDGDKITFGKIMNSPDGNIYTPISLLVSLTTVSPPPPVPSPVVDVPASSGLASRAASQASSTPRLADLLDLHSSFEPFPSPERPFRKGYGLSEAELLQSSSSDAGSGVQVDSDEEVDEKVKHVEEATYSGAKEWSLVGWTPQERGLAETPSLARDHEDAPFEDDDGDERTQVIRSASPLLELIYSPANDESDIGDSSDLDAASSDAVDIEEASHHGLSPHHRHPVHEEAFDPVFEAASDDDRSSESSEPLPSCQQPLPSCQPSARRSSVELLPSFSQHIKALVELEDDYDEESCASHLPSPEESPPRMVSRRLWEEESERMREEHIEAFWEAFEMMEEEEEASEIDEDGFDVDEDEEDDVDEDEVEDDDVDMDDLEELVELDQTDFDRACSGIMVVKAKNEFDEVEDGVADEDEDSEDGQQVKTDAERALFQVEIEVVVDEEPVVVAESEVVRAEGAGEASKSSERTPLPSPVHSSRKRLFSETDLALPEPHLASDDVPRDIAPLPKRPRLFKLSHVALGSAVGFVGGVVAAIAGLSALEGFVEAMEV